MHGLLSEEEFTKFADNLPNCINCINNNGTIMWANKTELEFLGYTKEEYIGQHLYKFFVEDINEETLLEKFRKESSIREHRLKVRAKNGDLKDVRIRSNISKVNEKSFYSRCVMEDLTEVQVAERKLETLEMLRQVAEANNKQKSQFIAHISHEIRTPMNGIIGLLEQTISKELPVEVKENIEVILDSSKQLCTLLNDMLDISKIESEKMTINIRPCSIIQIVEGTIKLFKEKADIKNIKLILQVDKSIPHELLGDPDRITQIVSNLVSNSIKFTDAGDIVVRIEHKPTSLETSEIEVLVEDTGYGISKEDEVNLFKEYFQTKRSTVHGGTGLGLAICKKLVVLLGGAIGYKQNNPNGSIFWFSLPLRIPSNALLNISQLPSQLRTKIPDIKSFKVNGYILVVEDSPLNQKVLLKHLQSFGFVNVDFSFNGEEAENLIQSKTYDLIFMDVQMPIKDGIETTKGIRRRSINTPIVALTAGTSEIQRNECFEAGMNDFLSKPVFREEIAKVLIKYLGIQ